MKIVGSMIVRNEADKYLSPVLKQLAKCCDEIRITDDASTDNTMGEIKKIAAQIDIPIEIKRHLHAQFDTSESAARQSALEWTFAAEPTHVVSIDADEFITNPENIRKSLSDSDHISRWFVELYEVWEMENQIKVRVDGSWKMTPAGIIWKAPQFFDKEYLMDHQWFIRPRLLACGREPMAVAKNLHTASAGTAVLHLGWADPERREARYNRYMEIDGGKFHNLDHLNSIMAEKPKLEILWGYRTCLDIIREEEPEEDLAVNV